MYIWQNKDFPNFVWDNALVLQNLADVKKELGRLAGMLSAIGFDTKQYSTLETFTEGIIMSSAVEGIAMSRNDVRSSVAWQLGIEKIGVQGGNRYVEGVVELMFAAINNCNSLLTHKTLFGWHTLLFPYVSRLENITVGDYRKSQMPMQVVSGRYGSEKVHYEAPPLSQVKKLMDVFLNFVNTSTLDDIIKAAVAHLWFVTIHPFSDGNGRLVRTITDMLLARSDSSLISFFSMSSAIADNRKQYYNILENTQRGDLDITKWILWFLDCLKLAVEKSLISTERILKKTLFWDKNKNLALNPRQKKIINMLFDGFEGNLTTVKYAKINKCSQDTALNDINFLIKNNILIKSIGKGKNTYYYMA